MGDKMNDFIKSFGELFNERLSSRYLGYLTIFAAICNYDIILILISNDLFTTDKIFSIKNIYNLRFSEKYIWFKAILLFSSPLIFVIIVDYLSYSLDKLTLNVFELRIKLQKDKNTKRKEAFEVEKQFKNLNEIKQDPVRLKGLLQILPMKEIEKSDKIGNPGVIDSTTLTKSLIEGLDYIDKNLFYDNTLMNFTDSLKNQIRIVIDTYKNDILNSTEKQERVTNNLRTIKDAISQMNKIALNL